MKLKQIKWRRRWSEDKSGSWNEANVGVFAFTVSNTYWVVDVATVPPKHWVGIGKGRCRSVSDGKRKAESWLKNQINKIVEE